MIIKKLRKIWY